MELLITIAIIYASETLPWFKKDWICYQEADEKKYLKADKVKLLLYQGDIITSDNERIKANCNLRRVRLQVKGGLSNYILSLFV